MHYLGVIIVVSIAMIITTAAFLHWKKRRNERLYLPVYRNAAKVEDYEDVLGERRVTKRNVEAFTDDEFDDYEESEPQVNLEKPHPVADGDIVILNVMAKAGQDFSGYDLLQSLVSAGLRYGEKKIFHRYKQFNNNDEILFSVASATEPGTFEIQKMGTCVCKGLSLFMFLTDSTQDSNHFSLMLETAKKLARDLDGIICDESHQLLSQEDLNQYFIRSQAMAG
jgi:cell division protein ZipA